MKKMIAAAVLLIPFVFALHAESAEQMPQANDKRRMSAEDKAKAEADRGAYSPKSITEDNMRLSPAMTPKRARPMEPIPWWQRG